ncbi:MAG TPA: Zn-dependent alcohol dehydrogenase [Acidimicrobiia bacterium]|jgi:S-(hydroxymethyl)glutathione dehydrogenase/alcohol dehydrogenase
MRGIVFNGEGADVRTDVEVIDPGPDEVLVRLAAAGVCHSDVSLLDGTIPWPAPSLMGHEGAGVVEAIGSLVTRVKPGDHVVIATVSNCGICDQCAVGKPTWCRKTLGNRREIFTVGGEPAGNFAATSSFAEMTVVKEVQAVPIDKDVPLTSACLIACGVVTGMGSVFNRANVQPGDNVAVFGAGGVGLSTIQALRIKAANHIIAVDTIPAKGELALQLGATHFINAAETNPVEAIKELLPFSPEMPDGPFGAGGVNWSFECVGHPAVTEQAVMCLEWGGVCVQVGVPAPGVTYAIPITHLTQVDRGIIGSRAGGVRAQRDIPVIVDLYKKGLLDLDSMVSKTYPLEDFHTVVEDMHHGTLARGVLTF